MCVANIVDFRTNPHNVECDFLIEPSFKNNDIPGATQFDEAWQPPIPLYIKHSTVFDALGTARKRFNVPVTIYLYDKN